MTISMPAAMTKWVRERVSSGEYLSLSDYFRQIVRDDQSRRRVFAAIERERQKSMTSLPKEIGAYQGPHDT